MLYSHSIQNPRPWPGAADLESVVCDYCGSEQAELLDTLPPLAELPYPMHRLGGTALDIPGNPIQFSKCRQCGLVYMNPRLTETAIARFYNRVYSASSVGIASESDLQRRFAYLLSTLSTLTPSDRRRLLDIGCGYGQFLKAAQIQGWAVAGTEISEVAAQQASISLGIPIHCGDFRDAQLGTFDVVTLLEVVEHLRAPIDYLRDAVMLLKPGGILLLEAPNIASLEYGVARLTRQIWRGFIIEHLYYFTPSFLRGLMTELGLSVEMMSCWTPTARFPNPLRDIQNIARSGPSTASSSIGSVSVPPLKPVSFPARVLRQANNYMLDTVSKLSEGWYGNRGNTIFVWARKMPD